MPSVPKGAPKKAKKPPETVAMHAKNKDGSKHAVGIGNLRVMILDDDGTWFAQGLEIDYAAQGTSVDDVKSRFEQGLAATVEEHLKVFGGIKNLLRPAPPSSWEQLAERACLSQSYSQFTVHKVKATQLGLPFEGISYIEAAAA